MSQITHLLNRLAAVVRDDTPADNGQGGWTPAPRTVVAALPCRVVSRSLTEQLLSAQRAAPTTHKVFTEIDADVQLQDVLTIMDAETGAPVGTFRIQGNENPSRDDFAVWQAQQIQRAA